MDAGVEGVVVLEIYLFEARVEFLGPGRRSVDIPRFIIVATLSFVVMCEVVESTLPWIVAALESHIAVLSQGVKCIR